MELMTITHKQEYFDDFLKDINLFQKHMWF